MKAIWRASTVLFILILLVSQTDAEVKQKYDLLDTITMQEVTGVCVHVRDLAPYIEKNGLRKEQIRVDVESKLKKAGVEILTEGEYLKTAGSSYLSIAVVSIQRASSSLLKGSSPSTFAGLHEFNIHVSVKQDVPLDKSIGPDGDFTRISTLTWKKNFNGSSTRVASIQESINNMVDSFIHDCLAVNAIRKQ